MTTIAYRLNPVGNRQTFAYASGLLQTLQDPAAAQPHSSQFGLLWGWQTFTLVPLTNDRSGAAETAISILIVVRVQEGAAFDAGEAFVAV